MKHLCKPMIKRQERDKLYDSTPAEHQERLHYPVRRGGECWTDRTFVRINLNLYIARHQPKRQKFVRTAFNTTSHKTPIASMLNFTNAEKIRSGRPLSVGPILWMPSSYGTTLLKDNHNSSDKPHTFQLLQTVPHSSYALLHLVQRYSKIISILHSGTHCSKIVTILQTVPHYSKIVTLLHAVECHSRIITLLHSVPH